MAKLVFDEKTPMEQYEELFTMKEGDLFVVVSKDYETVMERIEECKPSGIDFEVFPVNPGTDVYSLTGPDHVMVVKNITNVSG